MIEVAWVIVTIVVWSLIVAIVLSQKGVRTVMLLNLYGEFAYTTPNPNRPDFSAIGLFFYVLITPAILGAQIVLLAMNLCRIKIHTLRQVYRGRKQARKQ